MSEFNHESKWLKIKNYLVSDKNRSNYPYQIYQKKVDTIFKKISLKKASSKLMLKDMSTMFS